MVSIQSNTLNSNYNVYKKNINTVLDKNENSNTVDVKKETETQGDTIQISESNKDVINAEKAKNAFTDTFKEFKGTTYGYYTDMTGPWADMVEKMYFEGKSTPLDSSFSSTGSYKTFVDELTKTAKEHPDMVPSNFLDFCDKLKANLIKYDCK